MARRITRRGRQPAREAASGRKTRRPRLGRAPAQVGGARDQHAPGLDGSAPTLGLSFSVSSKMRAAACLVYTATQHGWTLPSKVPGLHVTLAAALPARDPASRGGYQQHCVGLSQVPVSQHGSVGSPPPGSTSRLRSVACLRAHGSGTHLSAPWCWPRAPSRAQGDEASLGGAHTQCQSSPRPNTQRVPRALTILMRETEADWPSSRAGMGGAQETQDTLWGRGQCPIGHRAPREPNPTPTPTHSPGLHGACPSPFNTLRTRAAHEGRAALACHLPTLLSPPQSHLLHLPEREGGEKGRGTVTDALAAGTIAAVTVSMAPD